MTLAEVIKRETALHFGLTRREIEGASRVRRVTRPRQIAMALCRHYTRESLPKIGRRFWRDHTTVLHAAKAVAQLVADPAFAAQVSQVCAKVDQLVAARAIRLANSRPVPAPVLLLPSPAMATPYKPRPAVAEAPPSWILATTPRRIMVAG
jgi:hypothetical protein